MSFVGWFSPVKYKYAAHVSLLNFRSTIDRTVLKKKHEYKTRKSKGCSARVVLCYAT